MTKKGKAGEDPGKREGKWRTMPPRRWGTFLHGCCCCFAMQIIHHLSLLCSAIVQCSSPQPQHAADRIPARASRKTVVREPAVRWCGPAVCAHSRATPDTRYLAMSTRWLDAYKLHRWSFRTRAALPPGGTHKEKTQNKGVPTTTPVLNPLQRSRLRSSQRYFQHGHSLARQATRQNWFV